MSEKDQRPLKKRTKAIHNCYSGYRLNERDTANDIIDCVEWNTVQDAKRFFQLYVHPRKPVKLVGALQHDDDSTGWCDLSNLWKLRDLDHLLRTKAGDARVHVEERCDGRAKFGRARQQGEVVMKFGDFLSLPPNERTLYYLTTQPIETDEHERPLLMSEPVASLREEFFPLRPTLAGNLIPMNYNLWMGCSSQEEGSTSGLHHDYHDNLYCVLKGRKRFTLYSPDQAENMDTRGTIEKVFENGLIHYEGEPAVCGDGVAVSSLKAYEADVERKRCERALEEAQAAVDASVQGAQQRFQEAEAALEEALDKVLEAEMQEDGDGNEKESSRNQEGNGTDFWSNMKRGETESNEYDGNEQGNVEQGDGNDYPEEKMLNFSRMESEDPVPGIPFAQVTLNEGDVLYLPAGWFHNVTSYSNSTSWHMAFNFWFHPPTSSDFDNPYPTRFWQSDWEQRMEE